MRQKSIYLPENGGRNRPGLNKWVSGRLSPSALSQLGMGVLHHPTRSVTSAGRVAVVVGGGNGASCNPASVFPLARPGLLWFHLTPRLHMSREEAPRRPLLIKVITTVDNTQQSVPSRADCKVTVKLNTCSDLRIAVKLRQKPSRFSNFLSFNSFPPTRKCILFVLHHIHFN